MPTEREAKLATAIVAYANADNYHVLRSKYSVESAEYLLRLTGVLNANNEVVEGSGITILELGCGTGLLTGVMMQALAGKAHKVRYIASDPTPSMGATFRKNFPDVEFIACAAENIPLAENSIDAVLAGACYHWFASSQAYAELYRVIRSGGKLGYIANLIPDKIGDPEWCRLTEQLIWEAYRKSLVPYERDFKWRDVLLESKLFVNFKEDFSLHYFEPMGIDACVRCLASWGGIIAGKPEDQEIFVNKLRALIDVHFTQKGIIFTGLPHVTEIFYCQTAKTE